MAKHKISKANQKVYFAGFYLEAIEMTEKDERLVNRKAVLAAHRESCVFHLVGAYEGLIWEVAHTYDIPWQPGQSLQPILVAQHDAGKSVPELEQLFDLLSQPGSWLQRMMAAWQRIQDLDPASTTVAKAPVNLNAIEVRVSMEEDDLLQLPDWHDKLRSLIDEIRERLAEW
jgi:hypothetical protein